MADWDGDGLPDLLFNSILGRVEWYRNIGTRSAPELAPAEPIRVAWPGPTPKPPRTWWDPEPGHLVTQWRTTPFAADLDGDGLCELAMLDTEGYLALFDRTDLGGFRTLLHPGRRIFLSLGPSAFDANHNPKDEAPGPLRLNVGRAGPSGRRKFCMTDWDVDGRLDLLVNSRSVDLLRNVADRPGAFVFLPSGPIIPDRLAGHDTSPTIGDLDGDGRPELIIGAEDGYLYVVEPPSP